MLCRALVDQLGRRTLVSFVTAKLSNADALLKTMLVDFGVISSTEIAKGQLAHASRDDLIKALRDFLASLALLQAVALLVVDDADRLPAAVWRELRALSEMAAEQEPLQVLLVGGLDLARLLHSDDLRPLDELVALRVELEPLAGSDIRGYVTHRLAAAGSSARAGFSAEAIDRVSAFSQGVPRVVNLICDRALTIGRRESAGVITGEHVDSAARELSLSVAPEGGASSRERLLLAVLMLALMLVGAAGAGWVLRAPLARAIAQWHDAPAAPQPPARR